MSFTGDLQPFTGRLELRNGANNKKDFWIDLRSATAALGDCEAPDPEGIKLITVAGSASTTFFPRGNSTIGPNRGITVIGTNVFAVSGTGPVTVSSPLSGDGVPRLTAGGTVTLTHASPNFTGSIICKTGKLILSGDAVDLEDRCFTVAGQSGTIEVQHNVAYVDVTAPTDRQAPYHTPARACHTITKAIASIPAGGRVILTAGQTVNMANETPKNWGLTPFMIVGAGDHTSVIQATSDKRLVLQAAGQAASNVVIRGSLTECWENGAVQIQGGHLIDSIVERFTQIGIVANGNGGRMTGCVIRDSNQDPPVKDNTRGVLQLADGLGTFACTRCVFTNLVTTFQYGAGAIASPWTSTRPTLVLDRCAFVECRGRCGVMRLGSSKAGNLYATNCLFASNRSTFIGSLTPSTLMTVHGEFVNCTLTGNSSDATLTLIGASNASESPTSLNKDVIRFVNTVVSGNAPSTVTFARFVSGGTVDVGPIAASHSLFPEVSGNEYTADNLAGPAAFRAMDAAPCALRRTSPGVGAGDASVWTANDVDLAGQPRKARNGTVDMGCYQWQYKSGLMFLVK